MSDDTIWLIQLPAELQKLMDDYAHDYPWKPLPGVPVVAGNKWGIKPGFYTHVSGNDWVREAAQ